MVENLKLRIYFFSFAIIVLCVTVLYGLNGLKRAEVYYCYYYDGVPKNDLISPNTIFPECSLQSVNTSLNPYVTCEYRGGTYVKELP